MLAIKDYLGLQNLPPKAKHLGLPLLIPRSKGLALEEIKGRCLQRIAGWQAKLLSQAGRSTLIQSVATAIPTYPLSLFLMPKSWCFEMDRNFRMFWWGFNSDKSHNLFLHSWRSICIPKGADGLGFRNIHDLNTGLVSKLAWRFLTNANSLWVQLLKSKYQRGRPSWQLEKGPTPSWVWCGVVKTMALIRQGACYLIGNGRSINVWLDPWIPNRPFFLSATSFRSHSD